MADGIVAGVVGASGFTGGELCRLLLTHPAVRTVLPVSRGTEPVAAVHPRLRASGLEFVAPDVLADPAAAPDVVFFCTPTGEAMAAAGAYLDRGVRVVDLSADFRFRDPAEYARAHGRTHLRPDLLAEAVYGLTETSRAALPDARLVANPGCYAITALLALLPLADAGLLTDDATLSVFAVNGTTGAGTTPRRALQQAQLDQSLLAYGLDGHRHAPEIEAVLAGLTGARPVVDLTTAHGPFARGIHLHASLRPAPGTELPDRDALLGACTDRYGKGAAGEPFVTVVDTPRRGGLNEKDYDLYPKLADVVGTNQVHLGLDVEPARGIVRVVAVSDNLGKGAAGSAVQNMNLVLGLDETAGLGTRAG